jgi:glycosyltransferase involved in cell wall biosynthesis
MIKWGTRECDVLYNMYCENLDFVRYARAEGLKIVTDVYINPNATEIVLRECGQFAEWADGHRMGMAIDSLGRDILGEMIELSDLLLCPSEWVVEGLRSFPNVDPQKVRVVPYGCGFNLGAHLNGPVPGRVFFAGHGSLRKGLHYLAQAADELKSRGRDYEFRVAGAQNARIRRLAASRNLTFLGALTKQQMAEEYLKADLFVLPTLSEGFASVCIEAMCCGVPVITTRCAGTRITDGVDGVIVPERDVGALTEAVDSLVRDRQRRDTIARNALGSVAFYSEENWGKRLVSAIQTIC